jgi:hypothetical protein
VSFLPGMPAKLHAPGRAYHKTKVRLRERDGDEWRVIVRSWSRKALKTNPAVTQYPVIRVKAHEIRLLPSERRKEKT